MSQPNQLPTAIRNIRARLRPFKRPLAWGSLGFVFLLTLFVWEYWHDREPIDFEALFPNGDSLLSGDARERAAEIDSSWAIEENLKGTQADSSGTNPENLKGTQADSSGTNPENLPKETELLPSPPKQANPNAPAGRAKTNPKLTPDISPEIDSFTLKIPDEKVSSRKSSGARELANPVNVGSASPNLAQGNVSLSGIPAKGAIADPNFWSPQALLPRPLQNKATQLSPLQAAMQQYPPLAIRRNYNNSRAIAPGYGNSGNSGLGYPAALAPGYGNSGNSGLGYPAAIAPGYGNSGNSGLGYPAAIAPGYGNSGNSGLGYPAALAPGYGNSGNSGLGYGYQGNPSINAIAHPNQVPNAKPNANASQALPTASGQNPYDILYSRPSTSASRGQPGYPSSVDNSAIQLAPGEFLYSPFPEQPLDGSALPAQIPLPAVGNPGGYSPPQAVNTVSPNNPSNSYNYLLQNPGAIGNNAPPVTTAAPKTLPAASSGTNFGAVNPSVPSRPNLVNPNLPAGIPQSRPNLVNPNLPAGIPQSRPNLVNPNLQNGLPATEFTSEFQNPELQPVQPRATFTVPRPIPGRYIGGGEINTFSNP